MTTPEQDAHYRRVLQLLTWLIDLVTTDQERSNLQVIVDIVEMTWNHAKR